MTVNRESVGLELKMLDMVRSFNFRKRQRVLEMLISLRKHPEFSSSGELPQVSLDQEDVEILP